MAWRAERQPSHLDEFVFATASGRPRDKDNVRVASSGRPSSVSNELRADRGICRRCRR